MNKETTIRLSRRLSSGEAPALNVRGINAEAKAMRGKFPGRSWHGRMMVAKQFEHGVSAPKTREQRFWDRGVRAAESRDVGAIPIPQAARKCQQHPMLSL
jgi:hypothetical protein